MPPRLIFIAFLCFTASSMRAADWPHWNGLTRDGSTQETSYWESGGWPLEIPVWETNVGTGCSSVIASDSSIYAIGWKEGVDILFCLDAATGETRWKQVYSSPDYGRVSTGDKGWYRGPSATPELDPKTGLLYTLSIDGELQAWDSRAEGKRVWNLNLYEAFKVKQRPQTTRRGGSLRDYGYTTAPTVYQDWLLVEVGSTSQGNLVAFDKRNGDVIWKSENRDPAGHTGHVVLLEVEDIPCAATLTAFGLAVTRMDVGHEGEEVATYEWRTDFCNNIPSPAVFGNHVYLTTEYNQDKICKFEITLNGAKRLWESPHSAGVCTPIATADRVYLVEDGLHCLDAESGKLLWHGGRFDRTASLVLTGDDKLIIWGNEGDLALVDPKNGYNELALNRGVHRDRAWPRVVLANGRLFCKDRLGNIKAFALSPTAKGNAPDSLMTLLEAERAIDLKAWPGEPEGLVLAWKASYGKRRVDGLILQAGRRVVLEAEGDTSLGSNGEWIFSEGAVDIQNVEPFLAETFQTAKALTLELIFSSETMEQSGPARIVTFSTDPSRRNFTLGQEGNELRIRLRTQSTNENGLPEIGIPGIEAGRTYHLLITHDGETLNAYLDGQLVATESLRGHYNSWTEQDFLLGNEATRDRPWRGSISGVALTTQFLDEAAAQQRYLSATRQSSSR